MNTTANANLINQAKQVIYNAIGNYGIYATASAVDNYNRVWSRDSMMTGITGLLINDDKIIKGLKLSISNLAKHQSANGQLPSNISWVEGKAQVSYGSLAGRADATTWWIIGTCAYLIFKGTEREKKKYFANVSLGLKALDAWEFNDRGLLYIPLGGNWADEYICNGYTLYDQCLRIWALELAAKVYHQMSWKNKANHIANLVSHNFSHRGKRNLIHAKAHHLARLYKKDQYFWSSFSPAGYQVHFDMPGNTFAVLAGLNHHQKSLKTFINKTAKELGSWLLPVHFPIIKKGDPEWALLSQNYTYKFKNKPYHFHNGGAWPIFLGWLGVALSIKKIDKITIQLYNCLTQQMTRAKENLRFSEYFTTDFFKPQGTSNLCFSAAGLLLLHHTVFNHQTLQQQLKKL